jgi:hypothetical protein
MRAGADAYAARAARWRGGAGHQCSQKVKAVAKAERRRKRAARTGDDAGAHSSDGADSSSDEEGWDIEKALGEKARAAAAAESVQRATLR